MIIAIILLFVIVLIAAGVLGTLFYFLDKRQQRLDETATEEIRKLQVELEAYKTENSALTASLKEAIETVKANQSTLQDNDKTLAKDIEILVYEFKKFSKVFQQREK